MKKKHTATLAIPRRAAFVLASAVVFLMALYMYFVMLSIFHVVAREDAIRQSDVLADRVATLEREYLTQSQRLTEGYAHSRGFVVAASKSFIERSTVAVSVASGNAR